MPKLEAVFAALSDRTRLRLLNLMRGGSVCVCYFVELLGESQPKISRHLAQLRRARLVTTSRDGKWIHYSIAEDLSPDVRQIIESTFAAMHDDAQMRRDRDALLRVCCAVKLPAALRDAPRPAMERDSRLRE